VFVWKAFEVKKWGRKKLKGKWGREEEKILTRLS